MSLAHHAEMLQRILKAVTIRETQLLDSGIRCVVEERKCTIREFVVSDDGIDGLSLDCFDREENVVLHRDHIYHWSEIYEILNYYLTNPGMLNYQDEADEFIKKAPYRFQWEPPTGLDDISEEMLTCAIELVKHGFIASVKDDREKQCVVAYPRVTPCGLSSEATLMEMAENAFFIGSDKVGTNVNCPYDASVSMRCGEPECEYELCPTALCGYIEYAATNGFLPELLEEWRKNRIDPELYEFQWKPENGLRMIPEQQYRLARQIVDRGLVTVNKQLVPVKQNDETVYMVQIVREDFCDKLVNDYDFPTHTCIAHLVEKDHAKTNTFTCPVDLRLYGVKASGGHCDNCVQNTGCVIPIAGYIKYLLDCGREDIIASDREYYAQHRAEIDAEQGKKFGFTLRDDLFLDSSESFLEVAELLQEKNYVSMWPKLETDNEDWQICYVQTVLSPMNEYDMEGLKHSILEDMLDRSNIRDFTFDFQTYGTASFQYKLIALAGYVDYLRSTGRYEEYRSRFMQRKECVERSFSQTADKLPAMDKILAIAKNKKESSLYCIIEGDRGSGKHAVAQTIADTLAQSGKINNANYSGFTLEKLASYTSYLDEFCNDEYGSSRVFANHTELDTHTLYVLSGLKEFLHECQNCSEADNSRASHLIDLLGQYRPNTYLIVLGEKKYIERFLELSPKIKFLFGNNIIRQENLSAEELYEHFSDGLSNELKKELAQLPEFRSHFHDYIALNRKLLPLGNRELSGYLADYANNENKLILPPDVYRKQSAKELLESIIGMKNVKKAVEAFEQQALFAKRAEMNGITMPQNNLHMVFTGNPGTGKTMIARVIAQMLYDFGIVPENKLVEVDRKDLVAGYIGQTAIKTGGVIDKAMGGVLFVDEAYSLASRSSNDFGAEAIATLIKAMEDHKDKLVVIFAGYEKEMHEFLNINPGISSRIGYTFKFDDYSADELTEMFDVKMKNAGFEYGDEIQPLIKDICDHFVQKRNFGNGRFVDKVIQRVLLKHSTKNYDGADLKKITADDIPSIEEFLSTDVIEHKDYETQLRDFIGMENVKAKVQQFAQFVRFQRDAKAKHAEIPAGNMHMIFTGNPGTGKTTIARIMVDMLYDIGVLKENKLIEVERKDLVAGYIGQTASKTAEVIDRAIDGVLFVDEAYSLASGSENDFGAEAIATLIKAMEDHKNDLIVIFAGYKNEMRHFLDINPGISSRIGYTFDFEDYTPDELVEMYRRKIEKAKFTVSEDALKKSKIIFEYFAKRKYFGNGRFVGKLVQETFMKHSGNISEDQRNLLVIDEADIPDITDLNNTTKTADASTDFERIIGMDNVKNQVKELEQLVNFSVLAREHGLTVPDANMHMIFTGNPGTGKTTIARIIAQKFYDIGVIKENKLVETERKDLIAGYIGQTAQKVAEVIDKAMGGVLFVDEAYSLTPSSPNDFGGEAIATLIKAMEDHKDDLVVIFAGYKDEMRDFEDANPGIASRIGFHIHFDDYTAEELRNIFVTKLKVNGFTVTPSAAEKVEKLSQYFCHVKNFGNGRFVDKVIQNTLSKHARIVDKVIQNMPSKHARNYLTDVLGVIDEADIPEIREISATMSGGPGMIDSQNITQEEHRRVAYHELGHALLQVKRFPDRPITKITINAEGDGRLGYVEFKSNFGVQNTRGTYKDNIAVMMAGLAAEKVFFGEYSDVGSSDINQASEIARMMVTQYGMSKYGFGGAANSIAASEEENELLEEGFKSAVQTIEMSRAAMNAASDYLLRQGSITEDELKSFFR